jgi:hypothetical protein
MRSGSPAATRDLRAPRVELPPPDVGTGGIKHASEYTMDWPNLTEHIGPGAELHIASEHRKIFDIKGNPVMRPTGIVRLRSESGPQVELPTGHLVLCDPSGLSSADIAPLDERLAPGRYATQFLYADAPLDGRVAFAVLWFRPQTPATFAPAPRADQKHKKLGRGETFAIGTDSASLCFADAQMRDGLVRAGDAIPDLWTRMDRAWGNNTVAELHIDGIGTAVLFSSGFGDGVYSFAWGLDSDGKPICLVVDLDVVESDLIPRAYARVRPRWRFW